MTGLCLHESLQSHGCLNENTPKNILIPFFFREMMKESMIKHQEIQPDKIIQENNPWVSYSIFDFCYFCCPECDEKSKTKQDFVYHASTFHNGVSLKWDE